MRLSFSRGLDTWDLWSERSFLEHASPYFRTLFGSGFAESVQRSGKRSRTEHASVSVEPGELAPNPMSAWCDSDDEEELEDPQPAGAETSADDLDCDHYRIVVTNAAYTTYRAVLLYLSTGHIAFAPLSSAPPVLVEAPSDRGLSAEQEDPESVASVTNSSSHRAPPRAYDSVVLRKRFRGVWAEEYPTLPRPASPKSVYRLAHLLQIAELQRLALASLLNFVTVENVAVEAFSPVSLAYDEVRSQLIDFIVRHWPQVKTSPSWIELSGKARRSEIVGGSVILGELLEALH